MPTSGPSSTLTEQIPSMRLKVSNIGLRWFIGALLVCLLQSLAWASSAQDVRGTVTDRSGAVISRAQVVLHIADRTSAGSRKPTDRSSSVESQRRRHRRGQFPGIRNHHRRLARGRQAAGGRAGSGNRAAKPRRHRDPHLNSCPPAWTTWNRSPTPWWSATRNWSSGGR